jgi:hypothetical protein
VDKRHLQVLEVNSRLPNKDVTAPDNGACNNMDIGREDKPSWAATALDALN